LSIRPKPRKLKLSKLERFSEDRMNVHKNARLTPLGRERMVVAMRSGQTPEAAARAAGVCPRTARKWLKRFEAEGPDGLIDRSSRPHKLRRPTPAAVQAEIVALRRQRLCGRHIAKRVGVSPATVSRVLRAAGLSRMSDLDPVEPVRRYERATPGELIHIDIKKLGRIDGVGHRITGERRGQSNRRGRGQGLGWEFAHVCVDDASRIAFAEMKRDETATSAVDFLKAAVTYYRSLGVAVARVMTDNGSCYKAFAFRDACRDLGLKHIRTKPYTPKTNGKAERFIQTALREWAYARPYDHSDQRTRRLPQWLHDYNWHRPHGGIHAKTPISKLGLSDNNLLTLHN
jgi:transposase InsO family protein